MGKWKWNILIVLGYVRIQTVKVHIIYKKALGWNSTHLILAIYRMVGKPTIWVEIQHAWQCDFEGGGLSQFWHNVFLTHVMKEQPIGA